jgi:hypothetical protein
MHAYMHVCVRYINMYAHMCACMFEGGGLHASACVEIMY